MKKVVIIVSIFIGICIVAGVLTLTIAGRDIAAPDTSDLMPEKYTVPDEQNAFSHLVAAADEIRLPSDLEMLIEYIEGKTIYDTLVSELLQKNAAVFPMIYKALAFEHCKAPDPKEQSYIQNWYRITILLGLRAVHDRYTNQPSQSVTPTVALLHFGAIIQADAQSLADINTSLKILQLGLNQAGALVHTESASKDDLQRMAEGLNAITPLAKGFQRAFEFQFQEVAKQIDGFRASKKNIEQTFSDTLAMPFYIRKPTWFPGYVFKENETKQTLAKLYRITVQNFPHIYADMNIFDLAEYLGLVPQSLFRYYTRPNLVGRLFYAFTTPEIDTFLEGKCQLEGSIRATLLLIALKSFEKDNGKLPAQLTELCPQYLPSVPLDPFDGKPFRYAPEKGIIYSVSKDLKDSGGSTELPPGEIYGPDYPRTWVAEDGVFKIN